MKLASSFPTPGPLGLLLAVLLPVPQLGIATDAIIHSLHDGVLHGSAELLLNQLLDVDFDLHLFGHSN